MRVRAQKSALAIVASVISLQAAHPAARVILITGDINLQNKADAAFTEVADPP